MESQSNERDHLGVIEYAADVPVTAIGDLHAHCDPAGDGSKCRHRLESRYPRQGTTAGVHHTGLPANVT